MYRVVWFYQWCEYSSNIKLLWLTLFRNMSVSCCVNFLRLNLLCSCAYTIHCELAHTRVRPLKVQHVHTLVLLRKMLANCCVQIFLACIFHISVRTQWGCTICRLPHVRCTLLSGSYVSDLSSARSSRLVWRSIVSLFIRCFVCSFLHQLGSPCMVSCFGSRHTNNVMHIVGMPFTRYRPCLHEIHLHKPLLVLHQSSDTCLWQNLVLMWMTASCGMLKRVSIEPSVGPHSQMLGFAATPCKLQWLQVQFWQKTATKQFVWKQACKH